MRISKESGGTSDRKSDSDSSSDDSNYVGSSRTKKKGESEGRQRRSRGHRKTDYTHKEDDGEASGGGRESGQPKGGDSSGNSNPSGGVPISSMSSGIGNDNPSFFGDEEDVFYSNNGGPRGSANKTTSESPPKKAKGTRKKKKFPPSPLPLYASPRKTSLTSRSPSSYNNDTDLVDYDDFGPSSSTLDESSDESELSEYLRTNNNKGSSQPGSSSLFYHNSSTNSTREGMSNIKAHDSWGDGGSDSRRASLYQNKDEPCSSSSLRERLANANTSLDNAGGGGDGSDNFTNVIVKDGEKSCGGASSEGALSRSSLKKQPSDKYMFSGVGRHFGRKKTLSSINLLEDNGESGGEISESPEGFLTRFDVLGWAMRLKAVTIILLSSTFILSTSSLLFVFPIIIDPILLGLEAQFSNASVLCRTTNIRRAAGSSECILQSCREGCTADSFQCTFIDVEYFVDDPHPSLSPLPQLPSVNVNSSQYDTNLSTTDSLNTSTSSPVDSANGFSSSRERRNGTLFININGCGYPPGVNCSEFHHKYGVVDATFECYFSQTNGSILVPNYSVNQQKRYLFLAFVIPIGLSVGSAISLGLLLKCRCNWRDKESRVLTKTPTKLFETAEGLEEKLRGSKGESPGNEGRKSKGKEPPKGPPHAKTNGISSTGQNHHSRLKNHSEMNGSTVIADFHSGNKANGFALQNTISGLMGMSSPHKIHESIKTLPHQHDSFEGNISILNGFAAFGIDQPETNHYNRSAVKRKPLYAKNNPNRNKLFHANSIDETRRVPEERVSNGIHDTNAPNGNHDVGHRINHNKTAEDKL